MVVHQHQQGQPGLGGPPEGATKAMWWSQHGAEEGVQGEHTTKPSLRNSLAHRDRRRSVLKVPAGASPSDSKAVWRRDWRRSRCSWRENRAEGMPVSPTEEGSPRANPNVLGSPKCELLPQVEDIRSRHARRVVPDL